MTASHTSAAQQLDRLGYLDLEVDPTLDLVAEINQLKKGKKMPSFWRTITRNPKSRT